MSTFGQDHDALEVGAYLRLVPVPEQRDYDREWLLMWLARIEELEVVLDDQRAKLQDARGRFEAALGSTPPRLRLVYS